MKKKPTTYIRIPYLAIMALSWAIPDMAIAASSKKPFVYDYTAENPEQVVIEDLSSPAQKFPEYYSSEIETPKPPDLPPASPIPPETPRPIAFADEEIEKPAQYTSDVYETLPTQSDTRVSHTPSQPQPRSVDFPPESVYGNLPAAQPPSTAQAPELPPQYQPRTIDTQVQPVVSGIYIVSDPTAVQPNGLIEPQGVNFRENDFTSDGLTLKAAIERDFIGQPIDNTFIARLKTCIQNYYVDCGYPLTLVCIPPQNVSCGIIQVIVQEATLGRIRTSGNCWNADDVLTGYMTLNPGDPIVADTLLTDLAWMNRNPFRYTQVSFSPGSEPGTTDIELITTDKHPWRIYAGADNTGSDETSQTRLFTGVTVGNLFGWDNVFSYQYTTSPDFHRFQSHTLNIRAPLSWKHLFMIYGGYSEVHPHIHGFHCSGFSYQVSPRYTIPLACLYGDTLFEATLGFDFKSTNNNLEFTDSEKTSIITGTVNLSQIMAGFNYGSSVGNFELLASVLMYGSPGELFDRESKKDYERLRFEATPTYFYAQLYAGLTYHFSWGSEVAFLVRAQQSTENLLPSEQFGIGGFDTVRGYKEREVNTDNGFIVNAELRSPGYRLLSNYVCCDKNWYDEIRFIAFFDYGKGFNHRLFHDERRDYQLASVGPGIRYQFMDNVTARLDWGIKLKRSSRLFGWGSKLHFGIIADF